MTTSSQGSTRLESMDAVRHAGSMDADAGQYQSVEYIRKKAKAVRMMA